jgi:hypothetical protein
VAPRVSEIADLAALPASELRDATVRFQEDLAALKRRHDAEWSPARDSALRTFYGGWSDRLVAADFDGLGLQGRVDHLLLANRIRGDLALLRRDDARFGDMATLLPFAGTILDLHERRRALESADPAAVGADLARIATQIDSVRRSLEDSSKTAPGRIVALRASEALASLGHTLKRWYDFHAGYDPLITWWARQPYQRADSALVRYRRFLRERIVGVKPGEEEPIVGDPIGRTALVEDLKFEMIPYGPEELVAIAEREFAWCEAEMKKAARDMGFGDDWRAALEKVKTLHVEPGKQPALIRDLAGEAVAFLEARDLVTIPPLAKQVWRMEMMSPERQRVAPFFLGGETIQVSFPTDDMSEEEKLMSMRGNNVHFARATVHHELIPGHHLQQFMTARYQPHRRAFATPFWGEGWALYWEMLLWDQGFPRSPEDRVGMLFWRGHRAARIIFSLRFHLGEMTPAQAIDMLVERVGHERANAEAEVRRSFNGTYPPLYQIAYMMGGLQFRALHRELVESGRMTNRAFHDAVLRSGSMPVEMVRALLTDVPPRRDHEPSWRFAGELRR